MVFVGFNSRKGRGLIKMKNNEIGNLEIGDIIKTKQNTITYYKINDKLFWKGNYIFQIIPTLKTFRDDRYVIVIDFCNCEKWEKVV